MYVTRRVVSINAHWRVHCITSLHVHVVYCEPDAMALCNASLHTTQE